MISFTAFKPYMARASNTGTAGMAMAVLVYEWCHLDSNLSKRCLSQYVSSMMRPSPDFFESPSIQSADERIEASSIFYVIFEG